MVSAFFWSLIFFCCMVVTAKVLLCRGGRVRDGYQLSCSAWRPPEAITLSRPLLLPVRLCSLCDLGHARGPPCASVSLSGNGARTTLTRLLGAPGHLSPNPSRLRCDRGRNSGPDRRPVAGRASALAQGTLGFSTPPT